MSARAWFAFAAVSVLWGMPYLFIKVAVEDGVPPVFLAWARVLMAAVLLLALAWRAGTLGSLRGHGRWLVVFAIVELAIPWPLIGAGEQHVSSSLAAILIAAVPLFVTLLAFRFDPAERAAGLRLVGLFAGFAGVVALVGIDVAGRSEELLGAAAILTAALGYAIGTMMLNGPLAGLDPRALMGAALGITAVVLTPLAAIDPPDAMPSDDALASIVVLGLFATAMALVLYGVLVAEAGPSRATVITYVAPIVAVALGVAVLDETLGPGTILGLVLILAGSWLVTRTPSAAAPLRAGTEAPAAADAAAPRRPQP